MISLGTLTYFRERNRNRVHDLVLTAFEKSGITQAEIARRLSKRPDVVCRLIGAPGNWTLDTVSDLLLAIGGLEPDYSYSSPFDSHPKNYSKPSWLDQEAVDFSAEKHQTGSRPSMQLQVVQS